jgi:carboxypeptidase PM20D1
MADSANTKKWVLYASSALLIIISIFIAVLIYNTSKLKHETADVPPAGHIEIDKAPAAKRLAGALRFKTVSHQDPQKFDPAEFLALHEYLEENFPEAHKTLSKETVSDYSLVYKWEGSDKSKKPIMLMAHQDVVPVIEGTEDEWTHPPFQGVVADGYIWGRGALDNKAGVTGILEAVEMLAGEGFEPEQTVYITFGHDEEVSGKNGAIKIAELLGSRGVEFEYILDEGGFITLEMISGVQRAAALIGVAEKGYLTLELTVESEGGHSSIPPPSTAVGILSRAVAKLEENPFPARLDGAADEMFQNVAPSMPFLNRLAFANLWLARPFVTAKITENPYSNAMVRTTTAATMLKGSDKENVLPIIATAVINFRILPGDTAEGVIREVERIIDDPRVKVSTLGKVSEPSQVSDTDTHFYRALKKSILQASPENPPIVAPYLLMAATDSRHYKELAANTYRFIGFTLPPEDMKGFHGTDERVATDEYLRAVRTYYLLLNNLNEES